EGGETPGRLSGAAEMAPYRAGAAALEEDAGVGGHRINLLSPRAGGRPFELPSRPTWQASEGDFGTQLSDFGFREQVSYVGGQEVARGTAGSVRPDLAAVGGESLNLSVDVKNYNFSTKGGRSGAVRDILGQLPSRQTNLPPGMRQGIILDARGQVVSQAL